MHPDTRLGWVHLSVAGLDRSVAFYQDALGLRVLRRFAGFAALGIHEDGAGPVTLVGLSQRAGARPKPPRCRGLYHFALRLPTRRELARALVRLARHGWPIDGAADHWVSEAVYLSDPDGHGIELYADRPREQWPRSGDSIRMSTEPLDWDGLMAELAPEERLSAAEERVSPTEGSLAARAFPGPRGDAMPTGTRLGHIHLHVSRLERAERFYRDILGLDLVFRFGPSALFFSAGGYHHHVGANIWAGRDAPPPPPDAVRLLHYSFVLTSRQEVTNLARRLSQAGAAVESLAQLGPEVLESTALRAPAGREGEPEEGFVTRDEDGQAIAVVSAGGRPTATTTSTASTPS